MSERSPSVGPNKQNRSSASPQDAEGSTSSAADSLTTDLSIPPHERIDEETLFNWESGAESTLNLKHIKGYPLIRKQLKRLVADPVTADHDRYERFKVGPPNLLFQGTHGTGKTHAARCLIGATAIPYVSVTPSDLMSQYVNRSGRLIKHLFHEADVISDEFGYSIIFADEVDALLPSRSSGDLHEENTKVVNQFLTELESTDDRGIIFIGATNCPETLDEAATRDGRIDETLTFDCPDTQGRFEILRYHLNDRPHEIPDSSLKNLAQTIGETTPARIKTLVEEAARKAAYNRCNYITRSHLIEQIEAM